VDAASAAGLDSDFNDLQGASLLAVYAGAACADLPAWRSAGSQDAHSLSDSPGFVQAAPSAAVDYQLTAASPCVGAGQDLSAEFTGDLFDGTRSSPWDIGCHARTGVPATPTPTPSPRPARW